MFRGMELVTGNGRRDMFPEEQLGPIASGNLNIEIPWLGTEVYISTQSLVEESWFKSNHDIQSHASQKGMVQS